MGFVTPKWQARLSNEEGPWCSKLARVMVVGINKCIYTEYVPTRFSMSGLPSLMLEYRGSCLVLALNPGSIFLVAATTSSIESFCVVVNVCAPGIGEEQHRRSLAILRTCFAAENRRGE